MSENQNKVIKPGAIPSQSKIGRFSTLKTKLLKPQILGVIIAIILLLIIGVFALWHNSQKKNSAQNTTSIATSEFDNVCGAGTSNQDCFNAKFSSCISSQYVGSDGTDTKSLVNYQISGPREWGCGMAVKYTKSSHPSWISKSMTCTFQNKNPLGVAMYLVISDLQGDANHFDCSGSLVKTIQSGH